MLRGERTSFFISTCLYIGAWLHFTDWDYPLAVHFDGLLGGSHYKESPHGTSRVLELSLEEIIRGPDMTIMEKNLFSGPRTPDSSCSRLPGLSSSRLLHLLTSQVIEFPPSWVTVLSTLSPPDFLSYRVLDSIQLLTSRVLMCPTPNVLLPLLPSSFRIPRDLFPFCIVLILLVHKY